jgi:hypothetical protein
MEYIDRRGFHPLPAQPPNKIFIGRVRLGDYKQISEILRLFPTPTWVATAAGRSPGSVTKYWNNLICKIDMKGFPMKMLERTPNS